MSQLQNFQHTMFGDLPVFIIEGSEWLGATEALSFSDPHKALVNHVEEDGWTVHPVIDSLGRLTNCTKMY